MKSPNPPEAVDALTRAALRSLRLARRAGEQLCWAKPPLMKTVYRMLAFALFIFTAIVFGAPQDEPVPKKAVINYSVAPWDYAAYEILIPPPKTAEGSEPFVLIDIWGNP